MDQVLPQKKKDAPRWCRAYASPV